MMSALYHIIIPFIVAMIATFWIHPKILKIAIMKNLVDNPDARKLQREPTPVMGGIAVFFGIIVGICSSQIAFNTPNLFIVTAAITVMLYLGTLDDILGLSPRLRFLIEGIIILVVMLVSKDYMGNFFGLWGIGRIPDYLAYPLTMLATVGIINAINLIDGVNGLSSGYCIMASSVFAIMFCLTGNTVMTILAATAVGALIPFFLHNVFGNRTKMFIGDGGALLMGMLLSIFVMDLLDSDSACTYFAHNRMGLIPFALSVLSISVFDTLRVMSARIMQKRSPFYPDKTHLHHLFIELGFSHIGTTIAMLTLNSIVIFAWFLAYIAGASIDVQFYLVLFLSILFTFIFYSFTKREIKRQSAYFRFLKTIGNLLRIEKRGIWAFIQRNIDKI